ncbi:MAG: prepilin-type N-terminal cleavage/methylation domain-containing protein, partial [Eubacterium sp.]
MGKYSRIRQRKASSGFTLVELMVSLALIAMVMLLSLSTLAFFNQIASGLRYDAETDVTFRRIHLVVQKQIERSDVLYIKGERVYLMDLENPTLYMDYYRHDPTSGTLYRCKVHRSNLVDIGPGQYS